MTFHLLSKLSRKLEFLNCDGKQAFDLLFAADNLGLEEALVQIQEFLIGQQREWMDKNFYSHHRLMYSRKSFNIIQNHYTTRIASNPLSIFEIPDSFNPHILSSLDEIGCLKLNETLWGFIVNWAKLQNPGLTNHVTNWRKDDWEEFKESLNPCIPWQSIMNLNWDEFYDLLIPCEPFLPAEKFNTVLTQQLKKACSSFSIKSPISLQFNETILNICQATLISSWIDKREDKPYLPAEIPYEFKLIIRGNRDGFSPDLFNLKCGNLQKTVVVFKMTEALYGGYNPLDWKFDHSTSDSFIFNFDRNQVDLKRLNRFAIHKKPGYGPCFGTEGLLAFPHGKRSILWMSKDNSNSLPILDYEVYQIFEKPKRANLAAAASSSLNHNGYTHKKR
ncbi:8418_t:CDS:2 [Funneliformis mosseae]|uniref:8418_t:CDS:1 n=1 Tax=Funneliformis mosseae TaxID=27381 RepID=A0A9N9G9V5_FUNMO|nr:8418_t:CDS:2 [Funneliformis mosseae]